MNTIKKFLLKIGLASLLLAPVALIGGGTVVAQTANVTDSVKQGTCLNVQGSGAGVGDGQCADIDEGDGSKVN